MLVYQSQNTRGNVCRKPFFQASPLSFHVAHTRKGRPGTRSVGRIVVSVINRDEGSLHKGCIALLLVNNDTASMQGTLGPDCATDNVTVKLSVPKHTCTTEIDSQGHICPPSALHSVCWLAGWFVGCLKSQQHASVSQGRICSDRLPH